MFLSHSDPQKVGKVNFWKVRTNLSMMRGSKKSDFPRASAHSCTQTCLAKRKPSPNCSPQDLGSPEEKGSFSDWSSRKDALFWLVCRDQWIFTALHKSVFLEWEGFFVAASLPPLTPAFLKWKLGSMLSPRFEFALNSKIPWFCLL